MALRGVLAGLDTGPDHGLVLGRSLSVQLRGLVTGASSRIGAAYARVTRTPMLTAEDVVAASLRGLDRGRLRVVTSWMNRLAVFAQRFLPRRVAAELYRPSPQRKPPS